MIARYHQDMKSSRIEANWRCAIEGIYYLLSIQNVMLRACFLSVEEKRAAQKETAEWNLPHNVQRRQAELDCRRAVEGKSESTSERRVY